MIIGKEVDEADIDNDNRAACSKAGKGGKKYEYTRGKQQLPDEIMRQCEAEFSPGAGLAADPVVKYMSRDDLQKAADRLRADMVAAAKRMDFIEAAQLRDQLLEIEARLGKPQK